MEWTNYITETATVISGIIIIGSALIWIYKKLVSDPDKKIAEIIQKENSEALKQTVEPLTKSIELLNSNLAESARDRLQLNEKMNKHNTFLYNHETRISVLEDWKKERKQHEN